MPPSTAVSDAAAQEAAWNQLWDALLDEAAASSEPEPALDAAPDAAHVLILADPEDESVR